MKPVIGITASTLTFPDLPGVTRVTLPDHYVKCTGNAGGLSVVLPNVEPEEADEYLEGLDGILLSGGCDVSPGSYGHEPHPKLGLVDEARDRFEIALVEEAHARGLPIFAICRGAQILNVARGGTLFQDVPSQIEGGLGHAQDTVLWEDLWHGLAVIEDTRLFALAKGPQVRVNSFHHQAADLVGEGLVVSARAPDGAVEGLEDPDHPFCVAVQWHPERRPADSLTQGLFSGFLAAARSRRSAVRV